MSDNSAQNILPATILIGFVSLLAGVFVGLPVLLLDWPLEFAGFAFVLAAIGLVFLIAAWHIRQGLVDNCLVRCVAKLINRPKWLHKNLKND
ncbi:MAG: hypothetical protein WCI54_15180 [Bacteroidia bacterium]